MGEMLAVKYIRRRSNVFEDARF